jgi:hypothetical protein
LDARERREFLQGYQSVTLGQPVWVQDSLQMVELVLEEAGQESAEAFLP